ncbi:MAG: hypothetical protein HS104_09780 [Polyangiaceae bacterium]|nr:hypothetical protein [Polyangiaceae bacterium]MCE7890377.1 hypothetical protein [Sorangiineae bacterium PRO1]MCL4754374.1 hypothetical protein [Myxococcales bacterium]
MATLIASLRAKGHTVRLDGMRVVVLLAPGADAAKAERWARQHEPQLRSELVSEQHAACGMAREVFHGGRVREVRDGNGEPIRGAVQVIESAKFEAVA